MERAENSNQNYCESNFDDETNENLQNLSFVSEIESEQHGNGDRDAVVDQMQRPTGTKELDEDDEFMAHLVRNRKEMEKLICGVEIQMSRLEDLKIGEIERLPRYKIAKIEENLKVLQEYFDSCRKTKEADKESAK